MGLQLSWLAIKDGALEDILDRLGLEVIGEAENGDGLGIAYARTEQGWSIVTMEDWPDKPDKTMATAAPEGPALFGAMTEIAMFSELRGYQEGRPTWSVTRDCDKPGLQVRGSPPSPFDDIRRRLEAEQEAETEQVDHLFDLPPDLSASLCGYEPYDDKYRWLVLNPKGESPRWAPLPLPSTANYDALSAAAKAELLPLLRSLGWSATGDDPDDYFVRQIGAQKQALRLSLSHEPGAGIRVIAWARRPIALGLVRVVRAYGGGPYLQLWKRFTWRRLWALTRYPADPVRTAIQQAKADILEIDAYLKLGVRGPRVQIAELDQPTVLDPSRT